MPRALFVTWDGPEQRYLEALFFPIWSALAEKGIEVDTLQLTWAPRAAVEANAEAARSLGLRYQSLSIPVKLRKLGAPALAAWGAGKILTMQREAACDVLMPRSIIPAAIGLSALALGAKARFLYEADGLMADERADFSGWSRTGPRYRIMRALEAAALRRAAAVTTRTEKSRQILLERSPGGASPSKFFVIPNSKDSNAFRPLEGAEREAARHAAGVASDAPWIVYAGSLGPQYRVPEMLRFFELVRARRPDARLHVLTFRPEALFEWAKAAPVSDVTVRALPPKEVASWLGAADLGLALRSTTFSQQAVCPIKAIEYLMSGLPVLASPVGDLKEQLGGAHVGRVLDAFSEEALTAAASWFLEDVLPQRDDYRRQTRKLARSLFDLRISAERYFAAVEYAMSAPA